MKELFKKDKYPTSLEATILNKGILQAVHDDDVETLFQSLGVLEKYRLGQCKCLFCNDTITVENFSAVIPYGTDIELCCNKAACITQLLKR